MDAPEKIYLTPLECMAASCQPQKDNTVEYTRTDAFIEKACDYINRHLALLDTENDDCIPEWLEKFKEAMKGE